jgi:hypothetical protein
MNSVWGILLFSTLLTVLSSSCKNDNCNDPIAFNYDPDGTSIESCIYEPKKATMLVNARFGEQDISLNDTLEIDGRTLLFSYYGMYLSNISFREGEEYKQWSDNVMLLRDGENTLESIYLNRHTIDGIRFDVGVDTNLYNDDPMDTNAGPTSSPLSLKTPSMYWGWAGGYRFISLEGMVDTSAAKDKSGMAHFEFHAGLPNNLKTVTFDKSIEASFGNELRVELTVQLDSLLQGIDFQKTDLVIHNGDNPTTVMVMNNAMDAFKIN